jgi:hypothetical protein
MELRVIHCTEAVTADGEVEYGRSRTDCGVRGRGEISWPLSEERPIYNAMRTESSLLGCKTHEVQNPQSFTTVSKTSWRSSSTKLGVYSHGYKMLGGFS